MGIAKNIADRIVWWLAIFGILAGVAYATLLGGVFFHRLSFRGSLPDELFLLLLSCVGVYSLTRFLVFDINQADWLANPEQIPSYLHRPVEPASFLRNRDYKAAVGRHNFHRTFEFMNPSIGITGLAMLLMCLSGYAALFIAPDEKTMHEVQRIFYFHLPSWIAMFTALAIAAFGNVAYLKTRELKWDWLSVAGVEVGLVCCTIGLITGPIWARPVWGIWWTWDARLTSSALLWVLYFSYLVLRDLVDEPQRRAMVSAVYGIFAFLDVPFVYMSNRIFRTQHPQPVLAGGPDSGLDPTMSKVLLLCTVAILIVTIMSIAKRYRLERLRFEVDELCLKIEYQSAESQSALARDRI